MSYNPRASVIRPSRRVTTKHRSSTVFDPISFWESLTGGRVIVVAPAVELIRDASFHDEWPSLVSEPEDNRRRS